MREALDGKTSKTECVDKVQKRVLAVNVTARVRILPSLLLNYETILAVPQNKLQGQHSVRAKVVGDKINTQASGLLK